MKYTVPLFLINNYRMLNRTLLPVWSLYREGIPIYVKEDYETFDWISSDYDCREYIFVRQILDVIPASRTFVKNYVDGEENDTINLIIESISCKKNVTNPKNLLLKYKYILNNWDEFVYITKETNARTEYANTQLTNSDLSEYVNSVIRKNLLTTPWLTSEQKKILNQDIVDKLVAIKDKFDLPYKMRTLYTMVEALVQEKSKENTINTNKTRNAEFQHRIKILEYHYKNPSRWNNVHYCSSLFGHPEEITDEMIGHMEQKYPDYRTHIEKIIMKTNAKTSF